MTVVKLKIDGMHCNSCKVLIEDALEDEQGVNSSEVSLENNSLKVEYDDSKINIDRIKQIIEEEGFKVIKE